MLYFPCGNIQFIPCPIVLGKRTRFRLTNKIFFPITISIYIIGKRLRKVFLDFCVFVPLFFMGSHIVPKCKVPSDIVPIVRLENMNLMGSLITAFAKIASARYSKFSEIFVAYL